jgi:hypothetical protein
MDAMDAGSAMYQATGPCAEEVAQPSLMGLVLEGGKVAHVTLHRAPAA